MSINKAKKQVLWVEDDKYFIQPYVDLLRDEGVLVINESNATSGFMAFEENKYSLSAIITDMAMAPGSEFPDFETKAGYSAGLSLARRIRFDNKNIPIVAFCNFSDKESERWFEEKGLLYLKKSEVSKTEFRDRILRLVDPLRKSNLQIFIVHGHDNTLVLELKNYIQNTLHLGQPIILSEQPSRGSTIIEKFEKYSQDATLVFVTFTPDDFVADEKLKEQMHRVRQNVIFELGYFYSQLRRRSGRVIVLHKGKIDIPSDIAGIVYIDVSSGVEAAGEAIRREISQWL